MSLLRAVAGVDRHFGGYRKDRPGAYLTLHDDGAGLPSSEFGIDDSMIPIFDQGRQGSCTGNGGAFMAAWLIWRARREVFVGSRRFLYGMTHVVEGVPMTEDGGAMPADMMKALELYGICADAICPYDDASLLPEIPGPDVLAAARQHQALLSLRCASVEAVARSIADGWPVGFGIDVYESFESSQVANSGIVPMPEPGEKSSGGHFIVATKIDPGMVIGGSVGAAKVRNSWSDGWGRDGYCWIPLDYWRRGIATDDWCLRREGI